MIQLIVHEVVDYLQNIWQSEVYVVLYLTDIVKN